MPPQGGGTYITRPMIYRPPFGQKNTWEHVSHWCRSFLHPFGAERFGDNLMTPPRRGSARTAKGLRVGWGS